ncbi:MAG: hypothetical protein KGL34_01775 [Gammaproteobacteria bacterium]|nr:hypothetical protein [Gammaproteobacteria bacterium]
MKFPFRLALLPIVVLASGCHMLRPDCRTIEDYQAAHSAAPLRVPAGMDSPDVKEHLVIPPAPTVAAPLQKGACLEQPPKYREAARGVAAGG